MAYSKLKYKNLYAPSLLLSTKTQYIVAFNYSLDKDVKMGYEYVINNFNIDSTFNISDDNSTIHTLKIIYTF